MHQEYQNLAVAAAAPTAVSPKFAGHKPGLRMLRSDVIRAVGDAMLRFCTHAAQVEDAEFAENEVYAIDIMVSTGEGKPKVCMDYSIWPAVEGLPAPSSAGPPAVLLAVCSQALLACACAAGKCPCLLPWSK